ncbi:MAG TPA: 50S ribosomal protein L9 [Gemmatimonadales bacterium]
MDVILREDIDHLGHAGELVHVKDGYARNFLIPQGLALHATEGNRRRIEGERKRRAARQAADRSTAEAVATRLADVSLTFTMKAGEGDRLFGSITAADIAEKLRELGHDIDKRRVELDEPIKLVGIYKVPVRLDAGVHAEVRVWVVRE